MALRMLWVMRWGLLAIALAFFLGGGCGQAVDETHPPPFLALRNNQPDPSQQESPDGGSPIQAVPIGEPGDPGRPVD